MNFRELKVEDEICITEIEKKKVVISKTLKERRKSLKFSQAYLSSQAGISKRVIENAENTDYYLSGKSISLDSFLRISNALDLEFILEASTADNGGVPEEGKLYSCKITDKSK